MGTVQAKEPEVSRNCAESANEKMESKRIDKTNIETQAFREDKSWDSVHHETAQTKPFNLQGIKARVDKIHVDGLGRTKDDIVESQVKELFKARDFQDVVVRAYKVRGKLEGLGCFRNIGVYIDVSNGPDATPEGVEVTFIVREMKRIVGGINTMVGNNEGSVIIGGQTPNLFGRGERLQMEYSYGTKNSSNINVSAVKPFVGSWLNAVLTSSVFTTTADYPWSGYKQWDSGMLFDLAVNPGGAGSLKQNFQYEGVCRNVSACKQASFSVREQCGPSLKSALRHVCSIDKRNNTIFPTSGSLVQFTTEVAGLGGDIGFVKNELTLQTNCTLFEHFTFQVGIQSGLLRSISHGLQIGIVDRFFLGGPMNLRGFEMRGIGPRRNGNALGGDFYWATGLHLYTPLPFRPGRNGFGDLFRLHGFINAGSLLDAAFEPKNSYEENLKALTKNVRISAGGGIAMKLGNVARVELNLVAPLKFMNHDPLRLIQFGIGLQYL